MPWQEKLFENAQDSVNDDNSQIKTVSVTVVGKKILPNVGNNAAERAHDHWQFLASDPRQSTIFVTQGVHAGHPTLVVLPTD